MRPALLRFLLLALPLVLLALGTFHYGGEIVGLPMPRLPGPYLLGLWLLEATGLVALFLLVHERHLGRWVAGVASGWIAWIFRGPVLALSSTGIAAGTGVAAGNGMVAGAGPALGLVVAWLGLYTVCGLLMASVAGSLGGSEGMASGAGAA